MKVQFSDNAFMAGPRAVGAEPAPAGKDFATVLAKASTDKPTDTVKKTADTVKKTGDHVDAKAKAHATPAKPKPEKIEDVPGHAYDEIVAGPRNGMFINDSGNARDGKAFVLVERDGRTFHIYGSGKDRVVVCLKRKNDTTPTPVTNTKPSGTTGS